MGMGGHDTPGRWRVQRTRRRLKAILSNRTSVWGGVRWLGLGPSGSRSGGGVGEAAGCVDFFSQAQGSRRRTRPAPCPPRPRSRRVPRATRPSRVKNRARPATAPARWHRICGSISPTKGAPCPSGAVEPSATLCPPRPTPRPTTPSTRSAAFFGVWAPSRDVARLTYFGLMSLQHRGQESAGIAVGDGGTVMVRKELGLVSQVFTDADLAALPGQLAIGHRALRHRGRQELGGRAAAPLDHQRRHHRACSQRHPR